MPVRALALIAFFASGASSLVFQSIWTRLLHHVFGATSVAMSSVLTAFMAGLGLGAHFIGRRAPRMADPLRAYALCELGVAAWALALPWVLRTDGPLATLNLVLREELGAGSFGFMVARFLCVLPLLLVPTTLMGGTLPLLAQHFVRLRSDDENASARTGALYAVNTLGAVFGTACGSFVLMPHFGVRMTNLTAVCVNALLGVGLLLLSRRPHAAENDLDAAHTAPLGAQLPAWARRLAVFAFAISGACAMTYEVVWSRALSMAIGSSLQAFALILVTFLIGIAVGSAVIAQLLQPSARSLPLSTVGASLLSLVALSPALVLENAALVVALWLVISLALAGFAALSVKKAQQAVLFDAELAQTSAFDEDKLAARMLLVPIALALFEATRFATKRSAIAGVALHGYLPYIAASVTIMMAGFLWLAARLRREPWLLASATQLSVALATFGSYVFQDEIPYTFARLVSSLDNLPEHVGTVRFFMLFAAGLCTLPATLGMGAMFPLTLALWSRDDREVGRDVGTVYAANTLGSIVGSWLPGFVLLPRIGMESTLRGGMLLNTAIAFALLLAWSRLRETRAFENLRRPLIALALASAGLLVWLEVSPRSFLSWNLSHMTLGAFRVSLAREVLDVASWGEPDLLYYRDGVSTTVSVERWGAHLSLKNNGKVDASNGDDMPTQVMVAAYPLLLHARGPRDLEVAVVGFGSGVTVGAALSFPVRHVDAMELEDAVVEAGATYFADVSHLPRALDHFPYVKHPRLTLHNDDGRNFLASTRKQYDVIISEPSNPWITGVSDLFTVDHFRISKQRLKPGGVYCQWVQLYEMSPENIKTIYRTFASQFRYVLAFAAEELSSDTILVGSDSPLPIDITHTARVMEDPAVKAELARAFVYTPHDVWSRTLFASREEILRFTHREERLEAGTFRENSRATSFGPCDPSDCRRTPAPLNTDDNMLIELRAPGDLIGFARYAGYLQLFYTDDWPYGELSTKLRGVSEPRDKAHMALSLLAHGRRAHAQKYLQALGQGKESDDLFVRTAWLMLSPDAEPAPHFEPPAPGPALSSGARRAVMDAHDQALKALARKDARGAVRALETISPSLLRLSGPSVRLLYGYALLHAAEGEGSLERAAVTELEELARDDDAYAEAHPELYFYLARALEEVSSFDRAVRTMRRYAERLSVGDAPR